MSTKPAAKKPAAKKPAAKPAAKKPEAKKPAATKSVAKPKAIAKKPVVKHQPEQSTPPVVELTDAAKKAAIRTDRQRSTSIEVDRHDGVVTYLFFTAEGVDVAKLNARMYEDQFNLELRDYPLIKAVNHYIAFATRLGATNEAMEWLAKLVNRDITKETEMATTKKSTSAASKAAKKPAAKKPAHKAPTAKERTAFKEKFFGGKSGSTAKKPAAKPAAKKATGEKRESAAQMFQDLIMEGKLTDDQIFKKVQNKFGLDDNKRGYVKWYRNHLIKNGKKPPKAKE